MMDNNNRGGSAPGFGMPVMVGVGMGAGSNNVGAMVENLEAAQDFSRGNYAAGMEREQAAAAMQRGDTGTAAMDDMLANMMDNNNRGGSAPGFGMPVMVGVGMGAGSNNVGAMVENLEAVQDFSRGNYAAGMER